MRKAIIFDFDGVIHDTFEFHRTRVQEFSGAELPKQVYKDMHNGNFFEDIPKEIKHINWFEYAKYVFKEQSNLKVNQEIQSIVTELSDKYDLYIITSAHQDNITAYLTNNNLINKFVDILGADSHKSKVEKFKILFEKYNLSKDNCVFITDTLGDILEANTLGITTIAVDFGYHDRKTLQKGNPYKIISNFADIPEEIKNLD